MSRSHTCTRVALAGAIALGALVLPWPAAAIAESGDGGADVDGGDVDGAPAPEPTPPPTLVPPVAPPAHDVTVRGVSPVDRLRRSPLAVEVVDVTPHKRQSTDLGEVLARTTSVSVQREGGLGSSGRYALAGLAGDRVRILVDGVPIELSPYQMGLGNVPVAHIDRAEVYQGVVPVRFGADALGGAIHLVTTERIQASSAEAGYQVGSFGTHRLALSGRYWMPGPRAFVRASAFYDTAANDYPVDVQVEAADGSGQLLPARVRRFHDGYRGGGVMLAAGLANRRWADRLMLQAFAAGYARDVQSDVGMVIPYGEVTYGRAAAGAILRYSGAIAESLRLEFAGGHVERHLTLTDLSRCRYDWFGECFVVLPLAGEIDSVPTDARIRDSTTFARPILTWRPSEGAQALRLAVAPTSTSRTGSDHALPPDAYDPLRAQRRVASVVAGLEHEATLGPLANVAFVKGYTQRSASQESLLPGEVRDVRASYWLPGGGDSLRLQLARVVYLKASYEHATRLPSPDELFGDGAVVADNLHLAPERSHNYNVGVSLEDLRAPWGRLSFRAQGMGRRVDSLIILVNHGSYAQYGNVLSARVWGADAAADWLSPKERFGARASVRYHDLRNTAAGSQFEGDRIPNSPFLQAAGAAFARAVDVLTKRDLFELSWNVRYVHSFLRGWASAAEEAPRLAIPSQLVHSAGLVYGLPGGPTNTTASLEVHNVTDERVFDFYGVQRPGRSFFLRVNVDYQ